MIADALAQEIAERRKKELASRINRYQRKNSILSDIGECERQMVYSVLDWEKKPLHDEGLQARFDIGNLFEREIVRDLQGMGFSFILSQMPVEILGRGGAKIASGKIDGFIQYQGKKIPIEIKSMNPNVFNSINSIDDFNKKPWTRKYLRQLQLYMFGNNCEEGLFICTDCLGKWALWPVVLDLGECEALLQRLERVHNAIQANQYPDRIPYDQSICGKCAFASTCLADIINKPANFIDNEALEQDIDRHEELKPLAAEYDGLHDKIKDTFKGIEKAVVGDKYLVMSVPSNRTTYEIPPEVEKEIAELKKPHMKKVPMNRLVIERLMGEIKGVS